MHERRDPFAGRDPFESKLAVTTAPSDDELRREIRARLSEGRLGSVSGASKSQRGTGGPCIVCSRTIEPIEVERKVDGSGVSLFAHEACYKPWREESLARRAGTAELGRERARRAASRGRSSPSGEWARDL